jgi:hypothetical protein
MDPITLLATASAIWSGIKKASEFAAEAEGVWGQLSKYCGVADQLEQVIQEEKLRPKKPKLFAKQSAGNEVQEAFNAFEAEHKLMQIEKELKHEFYYGAFCSLEGGFGGADGYAKFCNMRRKIRADRIKFKQEQQQLEKEFWDRLILWIGGGTVIVIGAMVIYFSVMSIINRGSP